MASPLLKENKGIGIVNGRNLSKQKKETSNIRQDAGGQVVFVF